MTKEKKCSYLFQNDLPTYFFHLVCVYIKRKSSYMFQNDLQHILVRLIHHLESDASHYHKWIHSFVQKWIMYSLFPFWFLKYSLSRCHLKKGHYSCIQNKLFPAVQPWSSRNHLVGFWDGAPFKCHRNSDMKMRVSRMQVSFRIEILHINL